jgi:hypothetical protein
MTVLFSLHTLNWKGSKKERLLPISSYSAGIEMDRLNETRTLTTIFESGPPKCKVGEHSASYFRHLADLEWQFKKRARRPQHDF